MYRVFIKIYRSKACVSEGSWALHGFGNSGSGLAPGSLEPVSNTSLGSKLRGLRLYMYML